MLWRSDRPLSPSQISDALDETLSNISYHVRVLVDEFGLLELADAKQRRGSTEHFYELTDRARESHLVAEAAETSEVPLPLPEHRQEPTKEDFNKYVGRLEKVERRVVEYRHGWNGRPKKSREEVAETMGIRLEKVRQIERGALLKVERAMQSDNGDA